MTLSAAELSEQGPKRLRMGIKPKNGFSVQQEFHPDEDIVAQLYRVPDGKLYEYNFYWISPSDKKKQRTVKVEADDERVYSELDLSRSMDVGKWQLEVVTGEGKVFRKTFSVSKEARLNDPRFRALGPRQIDLAYLDENEKLQLAKSFHPSEQIIILAHGLPYQKDIRLNIFWISPANQKTRQKFTMRAKESDLRLPIKNVLPFTEGEWTVRILYKKKLLAEAHFMIDAKVPIHGQRETLSSSPD